MLNDKVMDLPAAAGSKRLAAPKVVISAHRVARPKEVLSLIEAHRAVRKREARVVRGEASGPTRARPPGGETSRTGSVHVRSLREWS